MKTKDSVQIFSGSAEDDGFGGDNDVDDDDGEDLSLQLSRAY
jgi:hypothetical protein